MYSLNYFLCRRINIMYCHSITKIRATPLLHCQTSVYYLESGRGEEGERSSDATDSA